MSLKIVQICNPFFKSQEMDKSHDEYEYLRQSIFTKTMNIDGRDVKVIYQQFTQNPSKPGRFKGLSLGETLPEVKNRWSNLNEFLV